MTAPDPQTPPPVEPPAPTVEPPADPDADALGDPGKRALDRLKANLATEKAANADLARRLQAIEDEKLSALERAQKQASDTAAQLADLQRQNALLAKGIPGDLTPPNQTAGPEEWAGYADRLLAWRGNPPVQAPVPLRPDPSQGPRPPESDQANADVQYANAMAQLKPSRR